ncbi:hypothetical protein [Runella sp.]|uniref:hypothetical protein n=1 Tax=Runella sp. TaxID=1960881 RepID=UPI003D0BBCD6
MKYVCVKCDEELPYEQAFNAHTEILDRKDETVYLESVDDEWIGERCQICSKICSFGNLFIINRINQSLKR